MIRPPFAVAFVGIAGLIPFIYGLALVLSLPESLPGFGLVESSPSGGARLLAIFGAVILGFMGGTLWGFASGNGRTPTLLQLSATCLPVIIAVLSLTQSAEIACLWLAFGYILLQVTDMGFQRAGLVPHYWLSLRFPLTIGVLACLLPGALHG